MIKYLNRKNSNSSNDNLRKRKSRKMVCNQSLVKIQKELMDRWLKREQSIMKKMSLNQIKSQKKHLNHLQNQDEID